jgi:oligogalacturonide lyase
MPLRPFFRPVLAAALAFAGPLAVLGAPTPPKSWIDPDTGHRVVRLTDVPGTDSFYFNFNAYTPDGKEMVYTTPGGISVLNLETLATRPLVSGVKRAIIVGRKTPTIYYLRATSDPYVSTLWSTNIDTGATREIATLPRRATVYTINADETLGAGDFIEGDANAGGAYDGTPRTIQSRMSRTNLGEPANKGELMTRRFDAKLPMTLFTIDLKTGKVRYLLRHDTDWIDHEQFSPTDPHLLMFAHEGHWQQVDRIWLIRTDGGRPFLVHKRRMMMEIDGHEWWAADGETVWYQLQLPRWAPDASYLASYNVATGKRIWLHYSRDAGSIHHNISPDGKLFCGDGDPSNPWIVLCRPVLIPSDHTLGRNLIQGGYLKVERLVNMSRQNYRLEPNPSFTPDMKWVVFRSNMFGPDYVFAVSVAKAAAR